jgi:archaellin
LLYATDGTDGAVEDFRQKMKLSPGSDPISFDNVLLSFDTDAANGDYIYGTTNCSLSSFTTCDNFNASNNDGYCFDETYNNGTFSVSYLVEGPNHQDGFLVRGDVAMLCYEAPTNVSEDTTMTLTFVPKRGTPLTIDTATPNIMTSERIYIFP